MNTTLPQSGEVFDFRYRISCRLGRGADGYVFGATDLETGKRVAIKCWVGLHAEEAQIASQGFVRMAHEARLFENPHIVEVFAAEVGRTVHYCVTDWLEGMTLAQRMGRRRPSPLQDIFHIVVPCMRAIAEANAAGIVHGAIRPGHIFVCHATRHRPSIARIYDFGRGADFGRSFAAGPEGMPRAANDEAFQYASPERLIGAGLDARSDVYGFGVMLYEMLAGERAFTADSSEELARKIKEGATKLLASISPDIPMRLARVVERAMAVDPQQRYASLGDLLVALEPFDPLGAQAFTTVPSTASTQPASATQPTRPSVPPLPPLPAEATLRLSAAPPASTTTALALHHTSDRGRKTQPPPPPPRRTVVSAAPPPPPPPPQQTQDAPRTPPKVPKVPKVPRVPRVNDVPRLEPPEDITTTSASWEMTEPFRMPGFRLERLFARLAGPSGRVAQRAVVWCMVLMASMIAARAVQRMVAPAFAPERSGAGASQRQQAAPSLLDLDPPDCSSVVGATDPRCVHAPNGPQPASSAPIRPSSPWTREPINTTPAADAADSGMKRESPATPKRSVSGHRSNARSRRARSFGSTPDRDGLGRDAVDDPSATDEFYTPGEAEMQVHDLGAAPLRKRNVSAPREPKPEPRSGRRSRSGENGARRNEALERLDGMQLQ